MDKEDSIRIKCYILQSVNNIILKSNNVKFKVAEMPIIRRNTRKTKYSTHYNI